ncbi:hypothetical protein Paride_0261 [Pseudomonas phage Paride]|nr:hypothetical protein Deiofobo_0261 [Pseudomonas phage Deifobo]WPK40491.1 hypothetical protein Paride_0261 [Pseudomonas phage Paride]
MGPIEQDFQNFGPSFFGDVRVHRNMYYIIQSLFVHYSYLLVSVLVLVSISIITHYLYTIAICQYHYLLVLSFIICTL